MQVVVDANVVISVLISKGSKQDLLFSGEIEAISPEWLLFEVGKHWKELCAKSGYSNEEISDAFSLIREQIKSYPLQTYQDKLARALEFSPDIKDVEYLALALNRGCVIWSEDQPLRRQNRVRVLNTKELLKELNLI